MRSRVFFFALFFVAGSLALPFAAHAAIPFFGPIIPDAVNKCALGWGAVIVVINNIISFLITIAIVFVAPIMIAYSGFLYVVNPVSPAGKEKAKGYLWNTVIGIIVALAGWLIVDAVMVVLYNPASVGSTWSNLIMSGGIDPCLKQAGSLSKDTLNQVTTSGAGITSTGASGGGTCAIQNGGPCASQNMTIFGTAANQASAICSAESANGVLLNGDKTTDGIPVSFGLFQINITANDVANLGCNIKGKVFDSMYSGSHKNVQVMNQTLYNQCRQAALTPETNIKTAYDIFKKSGYSWRQWSTHTKCNLAFLENIPILGRLCAIISAYD